MPVTTRNFQSPLHRGRLFNDATNLYLVASAAFQSPLHRGRLFNYPCTFRISMVQPPLSVPSSSGKALQHAPPHAKPPSGLSFSPLFIGEGSSTSTCRSASQALSALSVPSSSGKALQPLDKNPAYMPQRNFQSPLHRGRLFNVEHDLDGVRNRVFQSPLHRGRLFNSKVSQAIPEQSPAFSPLFIGEGSSTDPESVEPELCASFSPLFIGEGSSTENRQQPL